MCHRYPDVVGLAAPPTRVARIFVLPVAPIYRLEKPVVRAAQFSATIQPGSATDAESN
jgi:hypothetical protein